MSEADFSGAQLQQAVLTKVYAVKVRRAGDGENVRGERILVGSSSPRLLDPTLQPFT